MAVPGTVPSGQADLQKQMDLGSISIAREEFRERVPEKPYALRVSGNIEHEDYLVCHPETGPFPGGKIYIVPRGSEVMARKVRREGDRWILYSSDGKTTEASVTEEGDFELRARVIKAYRVRDV